MKKKNLFLSMLAMASMLFATSCSQDELQNESLAGDYVDAKFTIETPDGINSRATIGNGEKANVVECAVFDADGEEMTQLRQTLTLSGKQATYDIRLVKGQAYRVAFFAYTKNTTGVSYYSVDDMENIVINTTVDCNLEDRDAFTNIFDIDAAMTMKPIEETVTLFRPLAQLNLGAYKVDIQAAEKAGVVVDESKIVVSNVYTAFNAYENAVTGETSSITFDMNTIPSEDLEVDIDGNGTIDTDEYFEYLALNYLLVGDKGTEKSLTDVKFVWKDDNKDNEANPIEFKNIPVQRNHRTNIIGYLLTNPAKFVIKIDETFEKPDYTVEGPWDGTTTEKPEQDANGTYVVKTAAEWIWLANNSDGNITSGNYYGIQGDIILANSIDLGGAEIGAITFNGTFDGQGNSIRNAVLTDNDDNSVGAGLFGDKSRGTIKNLTLNNITADENNYAGAIVSAVQEGLPLTLENVHVYDSNIKGVLGVGGLVGNVMASANLTLKDCSVNNTKVWNYQVTGESGHVAGLVGRVTGTLTIGENVETNNVEVVGIWDVSRKDGSISATASTNLKSNVGTITGTATVNGGSVTKLEIKENVAYVSSATEFAALNGKKGEIFLTGDVDFNGGNCGWILLSGSTVFDGQGYTLKNVNVTTDDDFSCGLFKYTSSGEITIKNLNIEEFTINNITNTNGDGFAGVLFGSIEDATKVTIDNVHINKADVCGIANVGGFVGYTTKPVTITNSSIKNSTIHNIEVEKESGMVAGIVGTVNSGATFMVDNTVELDNVQIKGIYAARRATSYPGNNSIDAKYGRLVDNATFVGEPTIKSNVIVTKTACD